MAMILKFPSFMAVYTVAFSVISSLLCSSLWKAGIIAAEVNVGTCAVSSENDLMDDSTVCRILNDLPRDAFVYSGQKLCFCVVATNACKDANLDWNGSPYADNTNVMLNRTRKKRLPVYSYCPPNGVTSEDNGTRVVYYLLDSRFNLRYSSTTTLFVIGPPTSPSDIRVYTSSCATISITWSDASSDTTLYYILNMQCGEVHVLQNKTVNGTNYAFGYTPHRNLEKQCVVSVIGVNPAGHSPVENATAILATGPKYLFTDVGVNIDISQTFANVNLNMSVIKSCPFSYPTYLRACVVGYHYNFMCVNITDTDPGKNNSWLYRELMQLPLHRFFNITIAVCNTAGCGMFKKNHLSTHHTQKAGMCHENGSCTLFCKLARGSRISGCVYEFIRSDDKRLPLEYVSVGENRSYSLGQGVYSISVYDWEDGRNEFSKAALIMFVSVKQKNEKTVLGTGGIVGVVLGTLALIGIVVCVLVAGIIIYDWRRGWRCIGGVIRKRSRERDLELTTYLPIRCVQREIICVGNVSFFCSGGHRNLNDTRGAAVVDESVDGEVSVSKESSSLASSPCDTAAQRKTTADDDDDDNVGENDRRVEPEAHQSEETSHCASDIPLLDRKQTTSDTADQYRNTTGHPKVHKEETPRGEIVVPTNSVFAANTSERQTGRSLVTGQPYVAPKDTTNAGLHMGNDEVKPIEIADDGDDQRPYSHATPSIAQTPEGNTHIVT